jgi:rRNA maturation protein Nop10
MEQKDTANGNDELFTVACCHCGKHFFKFSKNILFNFNTIRLDCPSCGGSTQVWLDDHQSTIVVRSFS